MSSDAALVHGMSNDALTGDVRGLLEMLCIDAVEDVRDAIHWKTAGKARMMPEPDAARLSHV